MRITMNNHAKGPADSITGMLYRSGHQAPMCPWPGASSNPGTLETMAELERYPDRAPV